MLLLEEHFADNRNHWYTHRAEDCVAGVEEGSYTFDHRRDGQEFWACWIQNAFLEQPEFRLHALLERVSGVPEGAYGIVWAVRDVNNFSEFLVRGDGSYRISRREDGVHRPLVDWTRVPRVRKANAMNLLEVHRRGGSVEFLVNRQVVATFEVERLAKHTGTALGFIVHDRVRLRAHSLLVSAPDGAAAGARPEKDTAAIYTEHTAPAEDSFERVLEELHALVGLEDIKRDLLQLAHFIQVQNERRRRGLKVAGTSLHMVLAGPPGTGKTTVARFLGRIFRALGVLSKGHVIETDRAGLVGAYLGQTALKVDDAVRAALDGVLFVDEAYALMPEQPTNHDYGVEALQTLLKRMEDHRSRLSVVIAGYTREMDRFLQSNPGVRSRFGRSFYFPHFKPGELLQILRRFCDEHGYTMDRDAEGEFRSLFEDSYARRDPAFGNARFVRNLFERTLERQATRVVGRLAQATDAELGALTAQDLLAAASRVQTTVRAG
ncbi:MAG: AAA family ATPase [Deltaproteobacteria bacterium]|nr:AAA family ATPase [Deltaproteobacteria bacterium]